MKIVTTRLILIFLLLGIFKAQAQKQAIDSIVNELHSLRQKMIKEKTESNLLSLNSQFKEGVEAFLNEKNSFKRSTDSLAFFGDLYSPDQAFRLLTWNIPIGDGEFNYYCYLQTEEENWFELIDEKHTGRRLENKTFDHTEWLGALYYEILPVTNKGETYYFLMGWDGKTKMSNRKILETMYFDNKGFPKFGKSVLRDGRFTKRRMILEYTEDAYVSLRYYPKKKMIVFSHLMPLRPELEGVYEFYAPDLSYDGFKKKGKVWELIEDVDVRSDKTDKPYKDPTKDTDVPVKIGNP